VDCSAPCLDEEDGSLAIVAVEGEIMMSVWIGFVE
jgi:hypothetical protein